MSGMLALAPLPSSKAPPRRMHYWINFIAFQLVWFAAVGGASRGWGWVGPLAFIVFAALHAAWAPRVRGEWRLVVAAIVIGFVVDTLMAASGMAHYAAPTPSPNVAPVWILALWAAFALTLHHSLAWMSRRPLLAALLGAVLGPVSYLGAGRVFQAVTFAEPMWISLAVLGACWFVALFALCHFALRWRKRIDVAAPLPLMRAP